MKLGYGLIALTQFAQAGTWKRDVHAANDRAFCAQYNYDMHAQITAGVDRAYKDTVSFAPGEDNEDGTLPVQGPISMTTILVLVIALMPTAQCQPRPQKFAK